MIIFDFYFTFLVLFLISSKTVCSTSMSTELIFHLQQFFRSDLILIAKSEQSDEIVKKLLKLQSTQKRGFIGVLDVNRNIDKFIEEKYISPYKNVIIFTDGKNDIIKKLRNINNFTQNLMASLVWVNYIEGGTTEILREIYIPYNNRFLIIKKVNDLKYEVEDVYQINENSAKIFSKFAIWKNRSLKVITNDLFAKRMDLKGYEMKVALSPFEGTAEQDEYLWKLFSERMNFSINWVYTGGGAFHSNGTKTGIFKYIYEREVDGTPSTAVFRKNRLDVYDYIFPTALVETKIYVEESVGVNWDSYIDPFSEKLWLAILLWIVLASVIMHIIFFCNRYVTSNYEIPIFYILRAFCYQCSNSKPSSPSLFISYLIPYIIAVVIMQYYSGALLSHLSVKNSRIRFNNLEDVVKDGSYKILIVDETYALFYFNTDPGPTATAVREKKLLVSGNLPEDSQTGFDQICGNKWIFLCEAENLVIKTNCDIIEIKEVPFKDNVGILVWKGFPFKDVLTKMMKRLQFAGLVKLKKKTILKPRNEIEPLQPFGIEIVSPIFVLYFIFMALAALILLCELNRKK